MSEPELNEQESSELEALSSQPLGARLKYYAKRTGPGWLQAAITLGGGSLAGALFLGVMMGYNLMWLQPLAMILGVVMLSAIAYVTLATGKRPFAAINEHVSPVLGWAWLIAAMMANIVWCLPQFALGTGAVQQNLVPSLENVAAAPWLIGLVLLAAAALVVRAYDSDSKGVKIFETILKTMVGIVVVSFFLVVVRLTMMGDLKWGEILAGFIPSISDIRNPAPAIETAIAATGDQSAAIWRDSVSSVQKSKVIAAFGTAVGINMTFLLPYSMLRKGWGKNHRGLAIFDLGSGLVIPFVIATACIVIAAASQFHAKTSDVLNDDGTIIAGKEASFAGVADKFISTRYAVELDGLEGEALNTKVTELRDALPLEDRKMAAMLVDRKDSDLAKSLSSLAGPGVGKIIFGIGVLGMALSTIIILMLINGFCLCEAMGRPGDKKLHFLGSLIPGFLGLCFPLIWTAESKAALAVPTSVIGSSLLPIAYFIFLLMMNSKKLLGNAMPTGGSRVIWNVLMFIATGLATFGSVWALKDKNLGAFPMGKVGIGVLVVLFVIGIIGFVSKNKKDAS
ncbi:MAG: divalent metal cation transporter [Verrucomicrobiales bacterium]|nr:divalent metal cation transporter [Verrucomicrobiales bacterium]